MSPSYAAGVVHVAAPEELRVIASDCRELFARLLSFSMGSSETHGACLYSALLTTVSVNRFTPYSALVRGGSGEASGGGYRGADGRLHGHYWTEVRDPSGAAWVVDLTADQFGGDAVVVLPLDEAAAAYLPGDQALVDEHVRMEGAKIAL